MELEILLQQSFETSKTCLPEKYHSRYDEIKNFVDACSQTSNPVALVTSGGTLVPLESNTVRFIDNFSSGKRGSSSAEFLLDKGYAVIFLHRHKSLKPFDRHFNHLSPLDVLDQSQSGEVIVKEEYRSLCSKMLKSKGVCIAQGRLLCVEFTDVTDYLVLLKVCCQILKVLERRVVLYLAAAVSDFHIPPTNLPEHKIQSSDGPINLQLQLVPKVLKPLVSSWIPSAYVVSFKLETDRALLIPKAQKALKAYRHNLVIGNILATRNQKIAIYKTLMLSSVCTEMYDSPGPKF